MTIARILLALLALSLLSACGTEQNNVVHSSLIQQLRGQLSGKKAPPVTTQTIARTLTPEVLAQTPVAVMILELPTLKAASAFTVAEQNGAVRTWFAGDGVSVATQNGVLVNTRGIGFDLMNADVAGISKIITGKGSGQAVRVHWYLDGEGQEIPTRMNCAYSKKQNTVLESCTKDAAQINNHYVLRNKRIVQSRQWLGEHMGYALITVVKE